MFAASLLFLVVLIGVALDGGRLYLTHHRLQRVVDAAALSGLLLFGTHTDAEVTASARQMAEFNLARQGMAGVTVTPTLIRTPGGGDPPATRIILQVDAQVTQNTFLVGLLPGLRFATVQVQAEAERRPLMFSLVFDPSISMEYPIDALGRVRPAAKAFVNQFSEEIDYIALTAEQWLNSPLIRNMGFFTKAEIDGLIDSFALGTFVPTNLPSGITRGREEILQFSNPPENIFKAMLIFTDGVVNVMRTRFLSPRNPPGCGTIPLDSSREIAYWDMGPGFIHAIPLMVYTDNPSDGPSCASGWGCPDNVYDGKASDHSRSVEHCLVNFAHIDSRGVVRGENITDLYFTNPELREAIFNLCIVESDYAKNENIAVYTIASSIPQTEGASPYQNELNRVPEIGFDGSWDPAGAVRTYLLRRIANDPEANNDPQFPGLPINPGHPRGLFINELDGAELERAMENLALRIRLSHLIRLIR